MKFDEKENSANIAMWYRDIPFTLDELVNIEGKVTKECWKYLIGKICLSEKSRRNDNERVIAVYERLGRVFGYVYPSLKRLVHYSNAIDRIQTILPDIASDILNGKTRLSLPDTIILAKMEFPEICNVIERLNCEKTSASVIFKDQKAMREKTERRGRPKRSMEEASRATIKDTPTYDPDAQIKALTYTIPSWVSMIERVFHVSDFNEISSSTRNSLAEELSKLTAAVETVTAILTEGM